jgi:aryl sulfotransferase
LKTIWLASYPRSGNTWFRILIASLLARDGQPVNINELRDPRPIASAREPFEHLSLIESGVMTHDEIDCLRPRVYEALAGGAESDQSEDNDSGARRSVHFVKVHDAYTLTPEGEPLLAGARGAEGAIVIVRDPRDIAPSLAKHRGTTVNEAIAFMNDPQAAFCWQVDEQRAQFRQKLPTWTGHVSSWLNQRDVPIHLVRYEDLAADTAGRLKLTPAVADLAATDEAINRAVRFADFARLQQQEQEKGFRETEYPWRQKPFFRRGKAGGWRDELTAEQVACIETDHGAMMRRLGYKLTTTRAALQEPRGTAE